jgi:hypothetical protein
MMVAATAVEHRLVLFTCHLKDFRDTGAGRCLIPSAA